VSTTAAVNERLAALTSAGTSVWLDQIRRSLIQGGELARMVQEESLRGVTANPSIFEKAILGSDDYDEELESMAREDLDAQTIYDRIAVRDVQLAADVLGDVHRESGGKDGFVSLEVAPDIAHDSERTLAAARTYWKALSRPNVMIKIPGTPEGADAIEQSIYEGININVTLLFAVEAYEAVAEAYLRGLERRQEEGKPLDVHSVASFFVSRVDTNVDAKLEQLGRSELAGTAAVANARAAYRRFRQIFSGPRWDGLRHAGARRQSEQEEEKRQREDRYKQVSPLGHQPLPFTASCRPVGGLVCHPLSGPRDAAVNFARLVQASTVTDHSTVVCMT